MLQLSIKDPKILAKICHALSTDLRLSIISQLETETISCLELANRLGYPLSTISTNVKILEEAGLVATELLPAKNGSKKLCSLVYFDLIIQLGYGYLIPKNSNCYITSTPIGNFMDFEVSPSCGYVNDKTDKTNFDDPNEFFDPARMNAQLLWFRKGFVEYRIPINRAEMLEPVGIAFELEICSESPGFNNTWKSDITMWVNGIEIGSWASPADFGGRRGIVTPAFWDLGSTQYGILTKWCISQSQTLVNGEKISDVSINRLNIKDKSYVTMRIGVKENAENVGGINIFGEKFGDFPQNIRMVIDYAE